jgi:curved DNA-binding protein
MEFKDYYRILGVKPGATKKEIKDAYRRKASDSHPDKYPEGEADPQLFRDVSEAYEVLSKPGSRQEYDRKYNDMQERESFSSGISEFSTGNMMPESLYEMFDHFFPGFFRSPAENIRRGRRGGSGPGHIHYDDLTSGS